MNRSNAPCLLLMAASAIGLACGYVHGTERITKLTNIESSYPYWSPDGGQIVFQSDRNTSYDRYKPDIFIMNSDGTGVRQLTRNASVNLTPVWSPDGKTIVYQEQLNENREIYRMTIDGADRTNLTNHPGNDSHPKWSPNGEQIIFDSDRSGNDELYLMNADGTEQRRLTDDSARDTYASISPDGEHIVWRRRLPDTSTDSGFGNSEVFVMNRDGSGVRNLTNHPAYDGWPSWSPDGTRIAFASDRVRERQWHIYVMDADGGNVRQLTQDGGGGGYFTKPIWSPSGTTIVCTRSKDGNVEIFTLSLAATNP